MALQVITGLVGGLAMFLYGMRLMGDSLQKAAGDKMGLSQVYLLQA